MHALSWSLRNLRRLVAGFGLLLLLAGVPAGLVYGLGWPLPTSVPTTQGGWEHLLTSPIPDTAILNLLAIAAWLLWAMFAHAVWVEAVAVWRGSEASGRSVRFNPVHGVAALIITTLAVGGLTTAAAGAAAEAVPVGAVHPAAATLDPATALIVLPDPGSAPTATHQAPLLPTGPAVLMIDGCPHLYRVAIGDNLWHIAEKCLGDPNRWEEIWDLNEGKFWPSDISGHKTLDNPDLIYPRWTLTLPEGASPSPDTPAAQPAPPSTPGPPKETATASSPSPAPASSAPTVSDPDDGVTGIPAPGGETTASPATSGAATPSPTTPTRPATGAPTTEPAPAAASTADDHGVHLDGGSWLPWSVVGAAVAAMAAVWLQRRRRYIPRPMDGTVADERPEAAAPPPTVRHLQHGWRSRPKTTASEPERETGEVPANLASPDVVGPVPPMDPLPAGGLGLTGPGAEAAARGVMVAALAAGAPTDPDARAIVIIPVDTMMTLLGVDAVAVGTWHRLQVVQDLGAALTILERRLLYAGRVLADNDVADIAALRVKEPSEEALPPMLLIADAPPDPARVRSQVVLGLGTRVDVHAVLLGEWVHGPTATVDTDGTCHRQPGHDGVIPARMPVLDTTAAVELLQTLREAHTGEPAAPPAPDPAPPPVPVQVHNDKKTPDAPEGADDADESDPPIAERTTAAPDDGDNSVAGQTADIHPATEPLSQPALSGGDEPVTTIRAPHVPVGAQVRVLGPPRIIDQPTDELVRSASIELMVYLAVHADGAHPDQVMEDMWMGVRPRLAASRLHTAVSNLRKLLAGSVPHIAAGAGDFVVKQHGRYRLNPDLVDVDLWRLRAAHTTARTAGNDTTRIQALRDVCDLYTGTLAVDETYEWIERHRHGVRGLAVDAHTALATALTDTDPAQAARMLQIAVDHEPGNEQVAQQSMRAYHGLGDADAIRAVAPRQLNLALDEIGTEPSAETADLADQLRRDLNRRAH